MDQSEQEKGFHCYVGVRYFSFNFFLNGQKEHSCDFYPVNLLIVTIKLYDKYAWSKLRTGKQTWRRSTVASWALWEATNFIFFYWFPQSHRASLSTAFVDFSGAGLDTFHWTNTSHFHTTQGFSRVKEEMSNSLIKTISTQSHPLFLLLFLSLIVYINWLVGPIGRNY